jgi:ketosteroid isomerase-like protein
MTEAFAEQTEADRETIHRAFEAWRAGTAAITEVFAPELVWRIEGHSHASGEYASKQQFVDQVLRPFGARFAAWGDPFRPIAIRSIHADGDTVIRPLGRSRHGQRRPAVREQLRLVPADARRQGHRRHRLLRQHLVQRPVGPSAC